MTPKEKAQELCNKFIELSSDSVNTDYYESIRQSARIVVDEILQQEYMVDNADSIKVKWAKMFWQQVKKEIEKL